MIVTYSNKNYFSIFLHILLFSLILDQHLYAQLKFIKAYNNPNEILDLAEMNQNVVWTTSKCGLSRWDLSNSSVITFNKRNSPLLRDYARGIAIKQDTVWVTSGEKIYRIVNDKWISFSYRDIGMPFEYDFDLISYDKLGRLWVSFSYGTAYYKNGEWTYFDSKNSCLYPYIKSMEAGIEGDMWFGHTQLWVHNLSQFTSNGQWVPHDGFYYPQEIAVENNGQTWVRRDGIVGMVVQDTILRLDKTGFGNIWAIDSGLRLKSRNQLFHKYLGSMEIKELWTFPDSMPNTRFLHYSPSQNTYYYVYNYIEAKGFIKQNPSFSWEWYDAGNDLDKNLVEELFLGPYNKVYIGHWENDLKYCADGLSLSRLDKNMQYPRVINDTLFAWMYYSGTNIYLNSGEIVECQYNLRHFDIADNGIIYFISSSKLYYVDNANSIEVDNCPLYRISYLCVDNQGHIWVADLGYGGFAVYDGYEWDHYSYMDERVAQDNIDIIYVDSRGGVWCATNSTWPNFGLSMYDGKEWYTFDASNGLPTPNIYQFAEDAFGNIWMATDLGLVKYDGNAFTLIDHTNSELPTPKLKSLVIDHTGNFWVGTENGLYVLNNTGSFLDEFPQHISANRINITVDSGHPTISWQSTNPPQKFAGFHLEKSRYGNKYNRIATIPFSPSVDKYSYSDTTTKFGNMYYRLVEYDYSGRRWTSLSDSISLNSLLNLRLYIPTKYVDEDEVLLHWTIDKPEDVKYFIISYKTSFDKWKFLQKVPSNLDTSYSYIALMDTTLADSCRIDAITQDGIVYKSHPVKIMIKERLSVLLPDSYAMSLIYPNPSNRSVSIDLDLPRNTTVHALIHNVLGQMIRSYDFGTIAKGVHTLNINLEELSSGIYYIYFNNPLNKRFKFTLIK